MSFIFDATKPVSPERQKVAKAMLQRQQMDMMLSRQRAPQNVGEGLEALGDGIANGLQGRWLNNQAKAPTDAWADMRQVGTQQPTMDWTGRPMGFGAPMFDGLKKLFG